MSETVDTAAAPASSSELVGREDELAYLGELLDEARSGRPRLVVLGGDAGVGKTRLLRAFEETVETGGGWFLVGNCVDLGDSALPFAAIRQVLRAVAQEVDRSELPDLVGPGRRELTRIAPELGDWKPDREAGDVQRARGRLFSAVLQALGGLACDRPLVVVVEDIHWADPSTLDLLSFVARNLGDERLLLIATVRTDELHRRHPARPVIAELSRFPGVQRLELDPLDDDAVARQVEGILSRTPDPDLTRDIAERSGGNPFYVEELVATRGAHGGPDIPSTLRDAVTSRLDDLPDRTREVLAGLAVAGRTVDHRLVEELSDGEVTGSLRPAVDRHVLVVDDDRYRFRHDLVREIVEDELLPGRRSRLHRRIAEVLEEHPDLASGGAEHVDAELAHHWQAAHANERAFDASLRGAQQASEAAAFAEALSHYERALELWDEVDPDGPDRLEILERAANEAWAAGRFQRGISHLRAALSEVDDDLVREAELRGLLAHMQWEASDRDAARDQAERAYDLLADLPASEVKAEVVHTLARLQMMANDAEAVRVAREATDLAQQVGDRCTEAHARATLGTALAHRGNVDDGIAELRDALRLGREVDDAVAVARTYNSLIGILGYFALRPRVEVEEVIEEALSWIDAEGDRWGGTAFLLANIALDSVLHGRWQRARHVLDRASHYHREGRSAGIYHLASAFLALLQGRLEDAAGRLDDLRRSDSDHPWLADWAAVIDARLAAADGRLEAVRTAVQEGKEALSMGDRGQHPTPGVARLVHMLVRTEIDAALETLDEVRDGHLERGAQAVDEMRDLLDTDPPPTPGERHLAETYILLAEAELSRAAGPDPDLWRTALDHALYPYWQLYARWRLAEALLDTGDRDEAAEELHAAHNQATDLGAELLRQEIETLARRVRIHLPGVEIDGPSELGLTPRETEVLELVAQGHTNRQIGEALYITPKTASVHVSHILSKLDVDDRYQAADRARDLGLVDPEAGGRKA